jgi:DNA helicase HerA-like ATPase
MTQLKEGDIVAVNNFATNGQIIHWSLIELNSVLPIHYALGSNPEDLKGFPGYIMAAAGNLPTDWIQQESVASEDTTKINCTATPLGLEIVQSSTNLDLELQEEESLPMVGSEVRLLTVDSAREILNKNLIGNSDTISVGTLVREPSIQILMDRENSIKTHIGIFGFTGVGKSNFLSGLIRAIVSREPYFKIVVFDLNNEYLGLLPDLLLSRDINGMILNIGEKTLNGTLQNYVSTNRTVLEQDAVNASLTELFLSRSLNGIRQQFRNYIEGLISQNKFKLLRDEYTQTLEEFIEFERIKLFDEDSTIKIRAYLDLLFHELETSLSGQLRNTIDRTLAQNVIVAIDRAITRLDSSADTPGNSNESAIRNRINIMRQDLNSYINRPRWGYRPENTVNFNDVIDELNDPTRSSLIVVNSFDPNQMREFAYSLGLRLYEMRRRRGLISPVSTFVFDEADEFIPLSVQPSSSYSSSKRMVEMVARRGRKFGIGLVISTQRATYLDTNIMGQLHTYFVSKLPRASDRERISEAFSVSEEMFAQTFKFRKGDWLFISHEAAGLDSIPIPIHSPNAEDRIRGWLTANQ